MHAAPPEIRILQVLVGLVPEPVPNVLADEGGGEIPSRTVAVDHCGRAREQLCKSGMCCGFCLLRRLPGRDIAPRPYDFCWLAVGASDQMLLIVDPAIGAVLPPKPVLHRMLSILKEL